MSRFPFKKPSLSIFTALKNLPMRARTAVDNVIHHRHVGTVGRAARNPRTAIIIACLIVLVIAAVVGVIIFTGGSPTLHPTANNTVVLTYDKQESTIPTDARTVGELIHRLHLQLRSGDVVEPSPDTEIIGDNFRINVYKAVPVTIVDGNNKTFTYSAAATPRSIVKHAGVDVFPEDRLNLLPVENFLTENSIGERVVIERATPVQVSLYGTPVTMRTHAKTVRQLILERHINIDQDDIVSPAAPTPITPQMQITLIRKDTQTQTVTEQIPMPVETINDSSLSFGVSAVRQQGAPGEKLVTFQIELQNGQEVGRTRIQEVVTLDPITQIVARGNHFDISGEKLTLMANAGIARSDFQYADYIISHESGWCFTKWQGEYGACRPYHGTPTSSGTGYGLCQSTPGWKMASSGGDWATNPITQLKWCHGYAKTRHGGWYGAYQYWLSHHNW